ncbi:DUF6233 domain-containing protein [Streptomyces qaidamensis]|uniref:DUF6233 domain-containing protein n=1 Tax=Streptomyces qaidamensis TaxID=1783515 RepID=UPI001F3F652E|nr:DUF6233 domain-containing protein [Streptomyces qaidamensis]
MSPVETLFDFWGKLGDVTDLPPDLPRLRTLETWLALTLDEVRRAIVAAERREAERQRGIEARPAPPDWLIELGLNRDAPPVQVHVGGCWNAGKRTRGIRRDEALRGARRRGRS